MSVDSYIAISLRTGVFVIKESVQSARSLLLLPVVGRAAVLQAPKNLA